MTTLAPPIAAGAFALGRFELETYVPSGRLGEMWRAADRLDGQPVMVRVGSPYLMGQPAVRDAFLAAGAAARWVHHPNVVRTLGVGVDEGLGPVCVTGFVPGESLATALVPATEVVRIGVELCEGLKALHERGILHGDLRPSAIRRRPEGGVVLLDAGMPRPVTRNGDEVSPRYATDEFTAPEVHFDRPGPSADLYGVAAVLCTLLHGRHDLGTWGWSLPTALPPRLGAVLERALAFRAEQRFPSAGQLAAELAACV